MPLTNVATLGKQMQNRNTHTHKTKYTVDKSWSPNRTPRQPPWKRKSYWNAVTTIVSMALSELASTPYFIFAAMQMPDHDI